MGIEFSWAPFNEKQPFGSTDAVVQGDNEFYSKKRNEAYAAKENGTATPEQVLLIEETDRIMAEAVANRRVKEVR